tara:strand:+ start:383 stop:1024 length:642 start_codon:yes stop_codon:yes gene_type:complete
MDEEISIINQKTRIENIKYFFKNNLKKIIIFFIFFFVILITFFIFDLIKSKNRDQIAQQYNNLILNKKNYSKSELNDSLKEIILFKDKTYSPLSLYYIIDNKLENQNDVVNKLFDEIISIKQNKEDQNLIIYKKALYNSDQYTENEMLLTLNPVINSESIWKQHGLMLMGDYYFNKKELIKSREFYEKILQLENLNLKIKLDAEKRLIRDLSE